MPSTKDCVVAAAVGYVMLITFFKFFEDKPKFGVVCSFESGCVRFCCRDESTCNEKFIHENFNATTSSEEFEYKIMFGEPKCSMESVKRDDWYFYEVSYI